MRSLIFALVVAWSTVLHAQDPVIDFSADDPLMQGAVSEARIYLDRVFDIAQGDDGSFHPAMGLKVVFSGVKDPEKNEVIWTENVRQLGPNRYAAVLANEPVDLGDWQIGDTVEFTYDQIADWSLFVEHGLILGHFTTRVILDQLPASQADPIWQSIGEVVVPPDWE